ncbi:9777_t:CDS:10 [Rhizophagus irregularis]|nr:9777_t:CDS:10 [Rhizophagus irregularis]
MAVQQPMMQQMMHQQFQFVERVGTSDEQIQISDPFKVEREGNDVFIRLINPGLRDFIRGYLHGENLHERYPKIPAHLLFLVLPELKKVVENDIENANDKLLFQGPSLVDSIETEYEHRVCEIKEMVDNNVISFNNLFYLFTQGQHIYTLSKGCIIGAKVIKATYHHYPSKKDYMYIYTQVIDSDGVNFNYGTRTFTIMEWNGIREIENLHVVPLPEESPIRNQLIERGRKFAKYAIGPHYLQCTGNMFRDIWFGTTNFKSEGRVMIDIVSFVKINPNYSIRSRTSSSGAFGFSGFSMQEKNGENKKSVIEDELFMCAPSLYGFSFTAKKWGEVNIDDLNEISFDDDAFDQLVMDPIKKDLISSLVMSKHKGVDLISGKGGGCIFLLHGPPGVGKTLTAEAISEYLHRPLYNVSVGELGTSVVELESKLSEILEVASIWNAVILIDEADIFLERRSENNIYRNALVSVFLRLLEYHQGILFLTTNRAREQVWYTYLDRIEGKNKSQVDVEKLKKRPLNGREIKTVVRLAKALATKNDPDALITTQQVETILDISKSFGEELAENDLKMQDMDENNLEKKINDLKMQLEKLEAKKKALSEYN